MRRSRLRYWEQRGEATSTDIVLAPVTVVPRRRASAISLELLNGRVIRVDGDVDEDLLARVIEIAERTGC